MSVAIKVEHLSKVYRLGQYNTGSLQQDLIRWWSIKLGREDPTRIIGESPGTEQTHFRSLDNVSFEVEEGSATGILGKNGAGKSTLLKILSRVTGPSSGKIKLRGRVASLLEVGTGFHPELTGRENVFLNGAILGMTKQEIKGKFDEIIHFSDVEKHIDTPVKRYSSGMYVRLAFSVASHLESEIMIIDEVLAVGDAEFQKKCIKKMHDLGKSGNRTILFVSHNMTSIRALCPKSILLHQGKVVSEGETDAIIAKYLHNQPNDDSQIDCKITSSHRTYGTDLGSFTYLKLSGDDNRPKNKFFFREKVNLEIHFECNKEMDDVVLLFYLVNMFGERVSISSSQYNFRPISMGIGKYLIKVPVTEAIIPGNYSVDLVAAHFHSGGAIDYVEGFMPFEVDHESIEKDMDYPWATTHGYIQHNNSWEIQKI